MCDTICTAQLLQVADMCGAFLCIGCSATVQSCAAAYLALQNEGISVAFMKTQKLAAHLDDAGQHFDGLICEVAATYVQLYNGIIAAQALTQCLQPIIILTYVWEAATTTNKLDKSSGCVAQW